MGRVPVVAVSAACALLLVGCTSGGNEPAGLTASPTTAATSAASTPTPTSTAAPTAGVVKDLSDPELGIIFENVPALEGDAADVYNWIATYNKEYWRTLTTNQVSPAASILASAEVQARLKEIASNNSASQAAVGGVLHSRISEIAVDGDTATGVVCDDYRDATFADVDGTYTPEEAGFGGVPRKTLTMIREADGRWTVAQSQVEGTC
ncbi:hypothetical protein [Cellulomonas xylanilytica]|uniref:Lipoprotein n=1 Tax=Cellulomonas xylanilytica TaxID=233583 RepID=A0A510V612_9CELL|nr:hypothetical protein [Cellulomonas xylanilytica]GEK22314.1 hypothetical protein CXY01_28340 [Cellulomonas xylanilytica]